MQLVLNPIFTSHMVLQADAPIRVFGTGTGTVKVSFGGHTACVSADGRWLTELPAMPCGGPFDMEVTLEDRTILLQDILLGDVYLLAGQSNMQYKLEESTTEGVVYEDRSDIRFFCSERVEGKEYFHPEDGWVECSRKNAPHLSAVGYFVGNMLYEKQGRPLGFVSCYQGAAMIQSFMSEEAMKEAGAVHLETLDPKTNPELTYAWNRTSKIYHFTLEKLFPMRFKAVIWYQGESNANPEDGKIYDRLLKAMIADWRKGFAQPELPFVIVQIADYPRRMGEGWLAVQEAQRKAAEWENVATVRSADISETDNIHPPTKSRLAERIIQVLMK